MAGDRIPNDDLVTAALATLQPNSAGQVSVEAVRDLLHDFIVTTRTAYGSLIITADKGPFTLDGVTPTKIPVFDEVRPETQEFTCDTAAGTITCNTPLVVFSLARINFQVEKNKVITPVFFADGVDSGWSGTTGVGGGNKPSSAMAIGMFDVGLTPVVLDLRLDSQDPGVDVTVNSVLWVCFVFPLINAPNGGSRQFFNG